MAAAHRLKGQELFLVIVANGVQQNRITSFKDCEVTFYFEIKEDDFLGEKSPRFDFVSKGVGLKMSGHVNDPQVFTFIQTISAIARRDVGPGVKIDVGVTFRFVSGLFGTFVFSDLAFADVPLNTGARDEFTEVTFDAKCSEFVYIG